MEKLFRIFCMNVAVFDLYDAPAATSEFTIQFFQMQKLWY